MTAHDIAKLIDHALLGRLLSGDLGYVEREIRAIVEAAHELKVEGCRICERPVPPALAPPARGRSWKRPWSGSRTLREPSPMPAAG